MSSVDSNSFFQSNTGIEIQYNGKSIWSVKIQSMSHIFNLDLPKDIYDSDKFPDLGRFIIEGPDGVECDEPNVGGIKIEEITSGKNANTNLGIQVMVYSQALSIEDMVLIRDFRIPWHAIARIEIVPRFDSSPCS